jgi:hypothetical protein
MFKRTKTLRRVPLRLFKRINFKPGPAEFCLAMAKCFSVNFHFAYRLKIFLALLDTTTLVVLIIKSLLSEAMI